MSEANTLGALRAELFATLRGLKDGSVKLDTARAINDVARTLVDTAKVEVDYLRVTVGDKSSFIEPDEGEGKPDPAPGITSSRVHRLR